MKIFKNPIFMFALGLIIMGSISVVANELFASSITYDNSTSHLKDANNQDVTTVQGAIDTLYNKATSNFFSMDSKNIFQVLKFTPSGSVEGRFGVGSAFNYSGGTNLSVAGNFWSTEGISGSAYLKTDFATPVNIKPYKWSAYLHANSTLTEPISIEVLINNEWIEIYSGDDLLNNSADSAPYSMVYYEHNITPRVYNNVSSIRIKFNGNTSRLIAISKFKILCE